MSIQDRNSFSSDLSFDKNLDNLEENLDAISNFDKDDLVYYNETDKKIHAVGGPLVQSLRQYEKKILDFTRLSKFVSKSYLTNGFQKIVGFFQKKPNLTTYATAMQRNIESTLKQVLETARQADNKEGLDAIKQKVEVLSGKLQSQKVQAAFQAIIHTTPETQNDIQAIASQMTTASEEIARDAKLAKLFFSPGTRANPLSRVEILEHIAEKGGSLQAYDVLTYEEFHAITDVLDKQILGEQPLSAIERKLLTEFPEKARESFGEAIDKLEKRMKDFAIHNPLLNDPQIRERVSKDLKEYQEIDSLTVQLKRDLEAGRLTDIQYGEQVKVLENRKAELRPTLQLILEAKKLMRTVMSEEGEGSWVDVYSFVNSGDPLFKDLADINAISLHQSLELDHMINEALMTEHLANQPKEGFKPLNAVVEGAGPNGLFTALQLFLSGSNVTVVNDRGERYVRNQIIDLDPKWAAQLRYFMGTKFDELFIGENAIGSFIEDGHYIRVNTKNLEDALKERMTEIASYASQQQPESPPLALLYEATFNDIQLPTEESPVFTAKLDTPTRSSSDAIRFNQVLIDSKAALILNTKYKGLEPNSLVESTGKQTILQKAYEEAKEELLIEKTGSVLDFLQEKFGKAIGPEEPVIDYQGKKITAKEQAALELEGKAPELRKPARVEFDFMVCCGGAGDPIRNKYLGLPKEETIPRSYGIAVFTKGDKFKNVNFLQGKAGRFYETMENLKPHLEKQQLDELISGSAFLSEKLRKKYAHLTEFILRGPAEDVSATMAANGEPQYQKDEEGNYILGDEDYAHREVQLRMFENKLTFYAGAETPPGISEFLKDLAAEKKERGLDESNTRETPEAKKYDALKTEIDRRWFASIAYKFMTDGHPENAEIINMGREQDASKMNFDPLPINTGTFPVVQYAVETAAKEWDFKQYNTSLIITVLGDARASPHFFSGSGMSTGRTGIENTAILVKDYHQGKLTKKELVAQLDTKLDTVKLQALEKGSHFVKRSPPEKKAAVAVTKMCQMVNDTCKLMTKNPIQGEHAFRIIRDQDVTPHYRKFKLDLTTNKGSNILVEAEVCSDGIICREKTYPTILDAVIALKQEG